MKTLIESGQVIRYETSPLASYYKDISIITDDGRKLLLKTVQGAPLLSEKDWVKLFLIRDGRSWRVIASHLKTSKYTSDVQKFHQILTERWKTDYDYYAHYKQRLIIDSVFSFFIIPFFFAISYAIKIIGFKKFRADLITQAKASGFTIGDDNFTEI